MLTDLTKRTASVNVDDAETRIARTARGRKYFDTLWNCGPAQDMRDRLLRFCPDHCEFPVA
jgi:hypothetical protein